MILEVSVGFTRKMISVIFMYSETVCVVTRYKTKTSLVIHGSAPHEMFSVDQDQLDQMK